MAAAIKFADRVFETSTTTGTGNLTLAGALNSSWQTFNAGYGLNVRFPYAIEDGTTWETGIGYLSGSTTLVRETIVASSNSNALVSFAAGTKNVYSVPNAELWKHYIRRGRTMALVAGNYAF